MLVKFQSDMIFTTSNLAASRLHTRFCVKTSARSVNRGMGCVYCTVSPEDRRTQSPLKTGDMRLALQTITFLEFLFLPSVCILWENIHLFDQNLSITPPSPMQFSRYEIEFIRAHSFIHGATGWTYSSCRQYVYVLQSIYLYMYINLFIDLFKNVLKTMVTEHNILSQHFARLIAETRIYIRCV